MPSTRPHSPAFEPQRLRHRTPIGPPLDPDGPSARFPLPSSPALADGEGEHFPQTADGAAPRQGRRAETEAPSASSYPADPGAAAKVARGGQSQDATARIPPCPAARGSVPGAGLDPSASNPATSPVGAGRSPAGVVPPAVAAVERLTRLLHEAERRRDGLLAGLRAVREELTGGDALARAIVEDAEASRGGAL